MVWGDLLNVHKVDVDSLAKEFRCVERKGVMEAIRWKACKGASRAPV